MQKCTYTCSLVKVEISGRSRRRRPKRVFRRCRQMYSMWWFRVDTPLVARRVREFVPSGWLSVSATVNLSGGSRCS